MVMPDGAELAPRPRADNAMVKALAEPSGDGSCSIRACMRRSRLGEGRGDRKYVSQVLRLTLLAPEIVEAILDGCQPAEPQLHDLLDGFRLEWAGQHAHRPRSVSG